MRVILFNHYHRGDLFTHKEFARHLKTALPEYSFEYWHFNHPKVNLDLQIPLTGTPALLNDRVLFYEQDGTIAINTWVGAREDVLAKHGGVNMFSLYEGWIEIFDRLGVKIHDDIEQYVPEVHYDFFDLRNVDDYLARSQRKRILICNGKPMSGQSFAWDMEPLINDFAQKNPDIDFICTKKITSSSSNVLSTDDIINDTDEFQQSSPHWHDRPVNNCDLNEISYLSTKCDAIIGKNSGPFCFCETKSNYRDPSKIMVSFSNARNQSMVHGVRLDCRYNLVTEHSEDTVRSAFEWALGEMK